MADSKGAGGTSAIALRPKVINFNILPAEYQQPTLSRQETLLVGIVVIGITLVFFLNGAHVDLQSEAAQTNSRVAQTNQRINQLRQQTQPQVAQLRVQIDDIQKRQQALKTDLDALKNRQLPWSTVLSKVFEVLPLGVSVDSLSQGGGTVTLNGRGPDYPASLTYAEKLRDSGLFSSVAFQVILEQPSSVPPAPPLSSPVPAGGTVPPGNSTPPGGLAVTTSPTPAAGVVSLPPTPTPVISTPAPVVLPTPVILPTPTLAINPSPTPTFTPGPSPTPSMTPTPSFTPTPTATATPSVDYMVVSKGFTDFPNDNNLNSTIRGRVIDPNNNPVPGLRFRISSCCPDWSAEFPREWEPASDGTFEFALTSPGTYTLEVLSGRSELVTDLRTGSFKGYRVWDLTFQKTSVGAPPPQIATATPTPTGSATPTPTGTITPTPTGTRTATPSPTFTVTPTPTVIRTPTATPTPTRTSTPAPTATFTVGNFGDGDQRYLAGGGYVGLSSVRPVALVLPAPRELESSPAAASPVSFVIILEVKAIQ